MRIQKSVFHSFSLRFIKLSASIWKSASMKWSTATQSVSCSTQRKSLVSWTPEVVVRHVYCGMTVFITVFCNVVQQLTKMDLECVSWWVVVFCKALPQGRISCNQMVSYGWLFRQLFKASSGGDSETSHMVPFGFLMMLSIKKVFLMFNLGR